jgi:hypothetical protein
MDKDEVFSEGLFPEDMEFGGIPYVAHEDVRASADIDDFDVNEEASPSQAAAMEDCPTPEETLPTVEGPHSRIEVAIPELTPEQRLQYGSVFSEIVEAILDETVADNGLLSYHVQFTDGRDELVRICSACLYGNI